MLRYLQNTSAYAVRYATTQSRFTRIHGNRLHSTKTALKESLKKDVGKHEKFSVGSISNGFMCTDIQHIKEFNMTAIILKHEKSKTEYLHLQRDDPNNVFSINFRTTPFNSTGLPHILEHTVLCGSSKFPVRDPFFKMLNRSLATFMNAMTGPDYTFYPFSSQNEVDYRNLQSIYLDAVFKPNLDHLDFLQEGWRLEHSDINDPKSDIMFKGVVFNEMKGSFSENSSVFGQKFLNTILPDHTYGVISGGDPLEIPNLTIKDLRDFHQKYYHPSNARIYSYGNFPLERNLEICDQLYLGNYEGINSSYSRVPAQPRWKKPIERKINCRFDKIGAPIEKQNQIAIGYLMCDVTDVYETFLLQFLSELMVLGPNSAFYKSLIEPNISGGYSQMTGYETQIKDTLFVVGLQDIEVDKFEMVKQIVDETLDRIIKEGFDKDHIASVLHGAELAIKHQTAKFGLSTLFNLVPLWNHEGSMIEAMQVGKLMDKLKENLKNPNYLSERVEFYFKKNNHKLTLTMVPDESYEENNAKMENDLLKKKISDLSDADKNGVYEVGLKLAEVQKAHQSVDLLPCLSLKDIPKELNNVEFENKFLRIVPAQICETNTNEVTYFKGVLSTAGLNNNLKMLVPLFNHIVKKMDTKLHTYREFDQLINLKTGGLKFNSHVAEKLDDPTKFEEGVTLSSHCLDSNIDGMLAVWAEVFEKPVFKDVDRFKMLLENYLSSMTNGIADSGHLFAMQSANSLVRTSAQLKEELSGLKHIENMKSIAKSQDPEEIMRNVSLIADNILNKNKLRFALNLSKANKKNILKKVESFCNNLPRSDKRKTPNEVIFTQGQNSSTATQCVHHVLNFPINFCGKAIVTVPFNHPDFSKLRVLARFLTSKYLHSVVREQNGAYGGGAKITNDGIFNFYSYRDPNSRVTLDVFDNASEWFKNCPSNVLDDQAIFEAKLGVLQQLDAPVAEYAKNIDNFLYGLNHKLLQNHRNEVLNVTKEDMMEVCMKYLAEDQKLTIGKCVIGPENGKDDLPLIKDGESWTICHPVAEEQ